MKHYHGTPISGTEVAQTQVLRGRFALIPWKAPTALEIALEVCRGVVADNSAYSFWASGETPNWGDYITWVKGFARHPRFEFAIIPDVIDGTERDNDLLIRDWDRVCHHPVKVHGCPVWHLHESMNRLVRLTNGRWPIVALGSSGEYANPGSPAWESRMAEAFDVICDEDGYPRVRIHGLRMLADYIVDKYPFYSCDSTNAAQNGARLARKLRRENATWGCDVLAGQIECVQSPPTWSRCEVTQPGLF
jgi:hypothetical protein